MSHIHTDPGNHDFTASAYIVRLGHDGSDPALYLHLHRHVGMWLHIGGHIELSENPWQALLREITEETGYDFEQLKLLQPDIPLAHIHEGVQHPWPVSLVTIPYAGGTNHMHVDIAYVLVTNEEPRGKPGEDETQDHTWFTATELRALPKDKIPDDIQQVGLMILENYVNSWRQRPLPQ